jgi:nicotinamidase-related amidase
MADMETFTGSPTTAHHRQYREAMNDLLEVPADKTVILTVDMQRDYLDRTVASLPVDVDEAERVLTNSKDLLDFARGRKIPVIHVYSTRRGVEIDRGFSSGGYAYSIAGAAAGLSQNPNAGPRTIPDRIIGSPQAEVPAVLVDPSDIHVATKRTADGYQYSELDMLMERVFRPECVVLTGVNTDTCVYSTTFSTANRGYKPIVIRDCVASMRGKDRHEMALTLMSGSIAWVVGLDEFKQKVR